MAALLEALCSGTILVPLPVMLLWCREEKVKTGVIIHALKMSTSGPMEAV